MKLKRTFLLWFFILAGIVLGAMLAAVCKNVSFLSWLSYYQSVSYTHLRSRCWECPAA